ncbi:protein of unknown function [Streptococcus thermophilus]|nr:protein of unknown function [Streptococcus thermophilus]
MNIHFTIKMTTPVAKMFGIHILIHFLYYNLNSYGKYDYS